MTTNVTTNVATSAPIGRTAFETADPDAAAEFIKRIYADAPHIRMVGRPTGGPVYAIDGRSLGQLDLGEVTLTPEITARVDPSELVTIETVRSGRWDTEARDGSVSHGPGDAVVAVGPGVDYRCTTSNLRVQALTLPGSAFTASLAPEAAAKPWRFLDRRPADPSGTALWHATTAYVEQLMDNADAQAGPLLAATAARMVAAAALTVFPNTLTAGSQPVRQDGADATPETVRRAVAFIEANAERDITLADIAQAAYVTPRAVQYAFRRHLHTTPLAHLRRVRLDAAHGELLAADPTTTTVTEVAARWGFAHPGHFSAHYRDAYRTTPSTTLNVARS
ncbi:AraC family transcriptional regulator [Kitasatospora purpeofusca]|uniref:helix-turn-helix transcriptional regulator n=1 Tax=Kitasatospora purpeofusca TaxID=67352 RepID=UPI0033F58F5B